MVQSRGFIGRRGAPKTALPPVAFSFDGEDLAPQHGGPARLMSRIWPGHVAGQRVDLRVTAADGYSAVRESSIASAPRADGRIELSIERLVRRLSSSTWPNCS